MPISFTGKGTPATALDFQNTVTSLGGDAASVWSLIAVETHGFGFLTNRRPQILFERHIFDARTKGLYSKNNPDISNPIPGGYSGGAAEYDRLTRAMKLAEQPALESASWGIGQVMGYNAKTAGYSDVYTMISAMVAGEGAQLQAVASFINSNSPLRAAFRNRDWAKVAFYYNGKNYAENHYDEKLQQHYMIFSTPTNRPDLDLRTAQACLLYLNYLPHSNSVDGETGHQTQAALQAFRKAKGLAAGGLDANLLTLLRTTADI